jgi:hypothetical protein
MKCSLLSDMCAMKNELLAFSKKTLFWLGFLKNSENPIRKDRHQRVSKKTALPETERQTNADWSPNV